MNYDSGNGERKYQVIPNLTTKKVKLGVKWGVPLEYFSSLKLVGKIDMTLGSFGIQVYFFFLVHFLGYFNVETSLFKFLWCLWVKLWFRNKNLGVKHPRPDFLWVDSRQRVICFKFFFTKA
jgi:hypothetical protein